MRSAIHMTLHFAVPALIAFIFYRDRFWQSAGVMWATMLVDLDHFVDLLHAPF